MAKREKDTLYLTMLELVTLLHAQRRPDETEESLVDRALALINSGHVVLTGNFAGCHKALK